MEKLILLTLDYQPLSWSSFDPAASLFVLQAAPVATEIRKEDRR
jgi:hypothetical protein